MPEPFKGQINVDIRDSVPDWGPFEPPRAPDGAPNVIYIVLDDVSRPRSVRTPGGAPRRRRRTARADRRRGVRQGARLDGYPQGKSVVVYGAAGSIGTAAVQLRQQQAGSSTRAMPVSASGTTR